MSRVTMPVVTGDYAKDCLAGAEAAEALVREMAAAEAPFQLAHVLRDRLGGERDGVIVGFLNTLAERAMSDARSRF